jgi:adenylylsulfate kinase
LHDRHWLVAVLDGDDLRRTVCADLGFERKDREENLRRIGQIANQLSSHCDVVLIAAIAPYRQSRGELRQSIPTYLEVFVNAPLEVCIRRDPKGLYRKALAGEIPRFTGVGDGYEPPTTPDLECNTDRETVQESVDKIVLRLLSFYDSRNHEGADHE